MLRIFFRCPLCDAYPDKPTAGCIFCDTSRKAADRKLSQDIDATQAMGRTGDEPLDLVQTEKT